MKNMNIPEEHVICKVHAPTTTTQHSSYRPQKMRLLVRIVYSVHLVFFSIVASTTTPPKTEKISNFKFIINFSQMLCIAVRFEAGIMVMRKLCFGPFTTVFSSFR